MTDPIEKWKEEFERWFDSHTNKNYGVAYYVGIDGKYCFSDIEMAWQSFLAARRSTPVVELPKPEKTDHTDVAFYVQKVFEALTAAGINYRIKGE